MKTIREVLQLCREHLDSRQIPGARREAEEIVSHALGMPRLELYVNFSRPLCEAELKVCRSTLQRRAQREPLQYIVGETEFFGCRIQLSPSVLIPRPETELLADHVARQIQKRLHSESTDDASGRRAYLLWDICCGSGCLGLSLKNRFPQIEVILSDLCPNALEVAGRNAKSLGLEVELRQGDLLKPFAGEQADMIVCNPPYVAEEEYAGLQPEVLQEPRQALVAENQGLACFLRLADSLHERLVPAGRAALEIGASQADAVHQLFSPHHWNSLVCERDWSGHDRFIFLEKE